MGLIQILENPETPLYCIGCGKQIFTIGQVTNHVMAMSCNCGAYSPVTATAENLLKSGDISNIYTMPTSLYGIFDDGSIKVSASHYENYIGFSDFTCPMKLWLINEMKRYGFTWMHDCNDANCIRTVERESRRREKDYYK